MEPLFNDLYERPIDKANVSAWLADWTALSDVLDETFARLSLANAANTADQAAEQRYHAFIEEVHLPAQAAGQKLKEKLLASGLEPDGFAIPLRNIKAEAEIFRKENLPLVAEELRLTTEYDKVVGAQTVQWKGEELTLSQMRSIYQNPDRATRENAWRLAARRQLADRSTLDELWKKFLDLRQKMAANAGRADYRSYRWSELLRFDYTPADCIGFEKAIEQVVVPAATRLYEKRRRRLGVQTLRPWDLDVDPLGRPPLKPFADVAQLKQGASSIFHRVDPQLGEYFDIMVREALLDLDNRKNKAPGGFCVALPWSKRPFIFMNAVGLHDDLQTVLHESGHAFHDFERDNLPYSQQRLVTMEFAEVASMGMELLAAPYLSTKQGGMYSEEDAARARVEHLESSILFWPYMAIVDEFQHWVYENPSAALDTADCDARWAELWQRFMPGVDWSGLDQERITGWQRKQHIFQVPFYYVEYGLAQLGAVQVWANALQDQAGAVAHYRRALALGGTVSLPGLFAAAGAKFALDASTLGAAVALMERTIGELEPDDG